MLGLWIILEDHQVIISHYFPSRVLPTFLFKQLSNSFSNFVLVQDFSAPFCETFVMVRSISVSGMLPFSHQWPCHYFSHFFYVWISSWSFEVATVLKSCNVFPHKNHTSAHCCNKQNQIWVPQNCWIIVIWFNVHQLTKTAAAQGPSVCLPNLIHTWAKW